MTWVPTAGRRKPHQRTGQQSITQQANSLPSDVLAAGQTPMPLPLHVCGGAARNTRFPLCKPGALTHRRVQHSRGPASPPHTQPEGQSFC